MWGPWMQPPSGGLRDLVLALAAPANASEALPRLRLTALMTASVLLGTLWTVWGDQTAVREPSLLPNASPVLPRLKMMVARRRQYR